MSEEVWGYLDRYFSGESTPREAAAVERWVAADPARGEELEAARRIWSEARTVRRRFDVQAAKANVHRKMQPARAARPTSILRVSLPPRNRWGWAVAAGLAAIVASAVVWKAARLLPSAASEFAAAHEYVTVRGQRSELYLSDGTRVMLGPESRLAVSKTYGAAARDVRLEGRGYFEVVHDEQRPFAVHAGGTVVRDLGTKFDVRAYSADQSVRVAVAEGKVALDAKVLSPGEAAERTSDGRLTVRTNIDLDHYLAWTRGSLVFDDLPLAEALPELERWYGLNFQLADTSLARLPVTGMLAERADLETLELLALLLGAAVEQRGDTVVIGRSRQ